MINEIKPMIINSEKPDSFFAASNSGTGFVSFFENILKDCQYKILIKGGPGTGKSYFMKQICKSAQDYLYNTEKIYCSSDIRSLDCVLIKKLSLAVVDATSPHLIEPKYPGVYDYTFDMSRYFDYKKLFEYKDEVKILSNLKSKSYENAYRYLKCANEQREILYGLTSLCVNEANIKDYIYYLLSGLKTEKKQDIKIRLCSANSTSGYAHFDSFTRFYGKVINISDSNDIAHTVMKTITDCLNTNYVSYIRSPNALNPEYTDAIYIPQNRIAFTINEDNENAAEIKTSDFIDSKLFSANRTQIKKLRRQIKKSLFDSSSELAKAGEFHSELEVIYTGAMDFETKEKEQHKMINHIFQTMKVK